MALAIQSHLGSGDGGDAALRALTKIIQVMPRRLRARLDAVRSAATTAPWSPDMTAAVDHDVLSTLALGCRDSERVRFGYRSLTGTPSSRRVEPHRLVPRGARWYLVAYDLDRHDWRTFRVDRITAAEGAGSSFAPRTPPFDDVATFVRAAVLGETSGGRHHVEVVVEAAADTVRARVGRWAEVRPRTPTSCTMTTRPTPSTDRSPSSGPSAPSSPWSARPSWPGWRWSGVPGCSGPASAATPATRPALGRPAP